MAGRSNRKKVQIVDYPQNQTQRSYNDLSRYEVCRVNSALSAAANFGKHRNTCSCQENQESEMEMNTKSSKKAYTSSFTYSSQSDTESNPELTESLECKNSERFTLTVNRKDRHRLEKALKLLEFIEGEGTDLGSNSSLSSGTSSLMMVSDSINGQTSTPRLQALQDQAYGNY